MKILSVLFPTDFSEPSLHAARQALALAKGWGSKFELLHVVELDAFVSLYGRSVSGLESTREQVEGEARKELKRFTNQLDPEDRHQIHGEIHFGHAAEMICNRAEERAADLIIMATHGRTGLSRLLLGSVTERVVRTSRCPVLTLRATEPER